MKTLLLTVAVITAAFAPVPVAQKQFPGLMPPTEYRAVPEGGTWVLTLYLPREKVQGACVTLGKVPEPERGAAILGCTLPNAWGGFTIQPNPCEAADESRAALACHENAHVLGWVHP